MPVKAVESERLKCILCGSTLDSEEEVLERICLSCIDETPASERPGWRQFVRQEHAF